MALTLIQKIEQGLVRVVTQTKTAFVDVNNKIGLLTGLNTTQKGNLVAAINEVQTLATSKASIDDTKQSATTTTLSANQITANINTAITGLIGGADANNDTLKELADRITATVQGDQNMVSAGSAQNFNTTQQAQARSNIGAASSSEVGDIANADFVATVNAAFTS